MTKSYHIAIVGATGAVGAELLRVLERRNFPVAGLRAISSARSTGKSVRFYDDLIPVQELVEHSFDKIDIAFFSAGGKFSREFIPVALQGEANVVDDS
jgi:aspartate-semialdehyde dehydrogenase